jgi:NodT family efflux transporter outer membrane factor (OMF) lipoprotein
MIASLRRVAVVGATTLIAALGGCDLGPDYKRPDSPTPGGWREGSSDPEAIWPSADWWRGFGSAELNEMMTVAQRANADIGAAITRVKQADAQVRIAGAPLLPSLTASGGPSTQQAVFPIGATPQVAYTTYTVQLNASYEVDFWGKNRAALASAQAAAHASRYDQEVVALTVVSSVANSYFQALGLSDRLQVARENLAAAENVLSLVQSQARVGTATDLSVAQQEALVANLRAAIPPLQQQYSQTLNALAILLNKPPIAVAIAARSLAPLPVPEVAPGLPSELLTRRPDVRQAEAQLISANANIKVARAAFFPSLSLTAAGGFQSLALSSFLGPGGTIYTLAAALTQPIFEGGRLHGQLASSKGRYEELVQSYQKAVISAYSNVEDALAATKRTAEQQASQQVAVAKARRAYELAQVQYRVGSTDLLTVLSTETTLFSANDQLAQARIARMQALVSLFKALGGGWQDGGNLNVAMVQAPAAGRGRR